MSWRDGARGRKPPPRRGGGNNNPRGNSNAVGGETESERGFRALRSYPDLSDNDDDDDGDDDGDYDDDIFGQPSLSIQPSGSRNPNIFGEDGEEGSMHDPAPTNRRGTPYDINAGPQRKTGRGEKTRGTGSDARGSGPQRAVKLLRRAPYNKKKKIYGNINLYESPDNLGEFVDDSPRRDQEALSTARVRILAARRNMGIELYPRPAKPPVGPPPAQHRHDLNQWRRDMKALRARHNNMRDPTNQEYNPEYVYVHNREKEARQTRNRIRRETALARMRAQYAAVGMPRPDTPLPPEDSSDEEDRWAGAEPSARAAALALAPAPAPAPNADDSNSKIRRQCERCRKQHRKCDWQAKYQMGQRCSNCSRADINVDCEVHYAGKDPGHAHTISAAEASDNLPRLEQPLPFRKIGLPNSSFQPLAFPPEVQPDTFTPCNRCLENPQMRTCAASRPCGPCILWNERDKCNQSGEGVGDTLTANEGFSSGPSRQIAALAAPNVPPSSSFWSLPAGDQNPALGQDQNQSQFQPHIQNPNQSMAPSELSEFIDPMLLEMPPDPWQNINQDQAQNQGQGNIPLTREEVFTDVFGANVDFTTRGPIRSSELPVPRNPFLQANTNADITTRGPIRSSELPVPRNPFLQANTNADFTTRGPIRSSELPEPRNPFLQANSNALDPQRPFNSILPITDTLTNGARGNAAEELRNTNLSDWQPQPIYTSAGPLDDPHAPQEEYMDINMDSVLDEFMDYNMDSVLNEFTDFAADVENPPGQQPSQPDWAAEDPLRLYAMPLAFEDGVYTWWDPYNGLDYENQCTEFISDSLEPEPVQCFKKPAKKLVGELM
ncbi:hypothetical protein B7494_g107 [Chlorociboria aeruginascens]|nr:hypothetical protein B7494_g107 [Chlorociboria aeruginascens]